jgi:nitroreductase/NAD-dependent dihydropyrimidine dehydrogenase PreA subunit
MAQEIQVLIDNEKCTGCGSCIADCQRHVLEIQNKKAVVINDHCLKCGHCLAVCPANAVELTGYTDEIIGVPGKPVFLGEKDLMTHLKFRRSIRQYKDTPVEKEKLEKIVEAGRLMPTASNAQNVRYIILQNEREAVEDEVLTMYKTQSELSETLSRLMKFPVNIIRDRLKRGFLFHKAPAVILVISQSEINACLAAMSMELMAETLGLGTLHVALFTRPANKNKKLRESLGIAEEESIAVCLALGYPKVQYLRSVPRKQADVIWR